MEPLRRLTLAAVCVGAWLHAAQAEHWTVIVAGSKGYWNYRHQADACHAYHVVRRHGIPEENVILMMYDDVATAAENPYPGKLFNMPALHGSEPMEVYEGCKPDYRGEDVTPQNFMSVLLGDADAMKGKKVLASGPDDRVFVNFVDHGGSGIIAFPDDSLLSVTQLNATLQKMYAEKRYKELVFYMEACESGSMFNDAQMSKINAFVTTAANATESSFGYYCPPMDMVNNQPMNTCLGDLYSINWMVDSDRTDLSGEKLSKQFQTVKTQTNLSHVLSFGNKHIRSEIVGNFQSNYDKEESRDGSDGTEDEGSSPTVQQTQSQHPHPGAVSSRDINLVLKFYKYLRSKQGTGRDDLAAELIREIESRERADKLFSAIRQNAHVLNDGRADPPSDDDKIQCHDAVFKVFKDECGHPDDEEPGVGGGFTSYSLQYAKDLTALCNAVGDVARVRDVLRISCSNVQGTPDVKHQVFDSTVTELA